MTRSPHRRLPFQPAQTLDRISRSALRPPDILYSYPPIPHVNDDDVPPHAEAQLAGSKDWWRMTRIPLAW